MIVEFDKREKIMVIKQDLELYERGFEATELKYNECPKCGGKMKILFLPLRQKGMNAYASYLSCPTCYTKCLLE